MWGGGNCTWPGNFCGGSHDDRDVSQRLSERGSEIDPEEDEEKKEEERCRREWW